MTRLVLTAVITMGCATAVQVETAPANHPASISGDESVLIRLSEEPDAMKSVFNVSPDRVWKILPQVYSKLEIGGQVLESDKQIYGNRKFTSTRLDGSRTGDFVRCGEEGAGPALGNMYRRTLSIVTTVFGTADGKTTLSTEISGYAQPAEGTSTDVMRCASNGKLEKRIRSLVNELLPTAG